MTSLEDVKSGASIVGVVPGQSVEVVSIEWIGDQAVNLVYRTAGGSVAETTLYRDDEHRLQLEQRGRAWSFDADGGLLRLVTEANRIKLAHYFDPYLAIHTSLVDPLPHQITAVYGEMLPRQPLRFLLADDPGAGKTIMAGLLIKELRSPAATSNDVWSSRQAAWWSSGRTSSGRSFLSSSRSSVAT